MKKSFQNLYEACMLGSQFHKQSSWLFHGTALQHERTRVEFLNEFAKLVILI